MNRMLRPLTIIFLTFISHAQPPRGHQPKQTADNSPQLSHVIPAPQNLPNQPAAPSSSTISATPKENNECSICLNDIESNETPSALPCAHTFHTACIHQWLATNGTCPLCRTIASQVIVAHNPVQVANQHSHNRRIGRPPRVAYIRSIAGQHSHNRRIGRPHRY